MCEGQPLPPYYDSAYRCEMEIVRFDSRLPNPKYQVLVNQLKAQLAVAPVLCGSEGGEASTQQLLSLANAVGLSAKSAACSPRECLVVPLQ